MILQQISIKEVFGRFITKKKKRTVYVLKNGNSVTMKTNSDRYILFKEKGLTCVCCGLTANKAYIEQPRGQSLAHINFYIERKGFKNILFTKDHIIPKCKGGEDKQENYQPMCQICNSKKGGEIEHSNF